MAQNILSTTFYTLATGVLFLSGDFTAAMEFTTPPIYTSYDAQYKATNSWLPKLSIPSTRNKSGVDCSGCDNNEDNPDQQIDSDEIPPPLEAVFGAAAKGDSKTILIYLQQGGSVNARNDNNQTLLHVAVVNGDLNITELLLRFGADINNVLDHDQKSPLDRAAARGFDFLHRFLAFAYGEFSHRERWQAVRHHIRIDQESLATTVPKKQDSNRLVAHYRKEYHKTPQQFRNSNEFAHFHRQFTDNIARLEQLTNGLFSTQHARELVKNLHSFRRHVLENDGSYFSARIGRIYGDIHQAICTIVVGLETLPTHAQMDVLEQLLTGINLCLDGVFTRTQQALLSINTHTTTEARVTEAYRHLLEALAIEQLRGNRTGHPPSYEVHYINAYLNYLSTRPVPDTDSAHWPNLQRDDAIRKVLNITETQLNDFAEKAAERVNAAEVIQWLTERTVDELQDILPQHWCSLPLQSSELTSERFEALNLWLNRLKVIVPDTLTLWELIEETEAGYDFSGLPFQLKRAIAHKLSNKLYPLSQPDLSGHIKTCNNLVYWTNRNDKTQPVKFADFQALLSCGTVPICDQLLVEVIHSTLIFSQLLHLLLHTFPGNRPDVSRRLLSSWYAHTLSNKKTREPFQRLVSTASNDLLQKIGLPDHYGCYFHDIWTGRELLKRLTGERVGWDRATALKNRLLQDPDLLNTELIEQTELLSIQQRDQLLLSLVAQGKTELLRSFPHLSLVTVNRLLDRSISLLCRAAMSGQTETVALLLDAGVNTLCTVCNSNALIAAANNGYTDTVALLLDRGTDVHSINPKSGCNALTTAASKDFTKTVALLLNRGADIHFINRISGQNALTAAARYNHTNTVALLLDRGADIHSVNPIYGWNALTMAANNGHTDTVALLLDRGADIGSTNQLYGCSALTTAASNNHIDTVKLLLDRKASIHYINCKSGQNALIAAARQGHTNTVALLLDRGADVHSVNPAHGWSTLTVAASNGHTDTVALLLDRGADIHFTNRKGGQNALIAAARQGRTSTVALLLNRGADLHFVNPVCGSSALSTAIDHGHTDTARLLCDWEAGFRSATIKLLYDWEAGFRSATI